MGIYTQYEYPWVDEQIGRRLQSISHIITQKIPCVRSVLLTGGFGKGEGSVEIKQNREVVCLRDFDVVVIVDRMPKKKTKQELYDEIYNFLGLPNPERKVFRFSDFVVDVYFRRVEDLIYPDIWFYDLKASSRLLYGEDVRNLIPWTKKDIPLSSGLRILFEKVCGLLGNFAYSFLHMEKLPEEQEKLLIFECYKTFIEICTALSILAGRYEPRYTSRANNLATFYFDKFPDFAKVLPDLPLKVIKFTDFKLAPDFTKVDEDPVDLWFHTRDSLGVTIALYIRRYIGLTLSKWIDSPKQMKIVARHYYKPFLKSLMQAKLRFSDRILLDAASLFYQILANFEYAYVVTRYTGRLYWSPLRRCYMSPSLKFFQAGIMTLLSLNRDGDTNANLLAKAAEELRHCISVKMSSFEASEWETLRIQFLKAYRLYRGYHFVK